LCQAIIANDFHTASNLLPTKIELVFDQPKICEMVTAIGENSVKLMVQFELIKLNDLMSVSGNLNQAQIDFISDQLVNMYPGESIADFKICFSRGAMGRYGDIQRLDGITIGNWFTIYLEQKYQLLESRLMEEKENFYKPVYPEVSNVDWHKKWKDEIDSIKSNPVIKMTSDEIEKEGQVRPAKKVYVSPEQNYINQADQQLKHFQELTVRERHPEWNEEQIQERLKELDSHVKYSTDVNKIIGIDKKNLSY